MEIFGFLAVVAIIGLAVIIGAVMSGASGKSLASSFASLGDLRGKTLAEILARVGGAQIVQTLPDG